MGHWCVTDPSSCAWLCPVVHSKLSALLDPRPFPVQDREEISALAISLGASLDATELESAMMEMDTKNSGEVDFDDFSMWWKSEASNSKLKQAVQKKHHVDDTGAVTRFLQNLKLPSRKELQQWGHPCLEYDLDQIIGCTVEILTDPELGIMDEFELQFETIVAFCGEVYKRYRKIPYHNMYHGFNVLQGSYCLIMTTESCKKLTQLEKLSMLIAGLGHDLGHDGVNTHFHVASNTDLALRCDGDYFLLSAELHWPGRHDPPACRRLSQVQ